MAEGTIVVEKSKKEDSSVLAIAKVEAKSDRPSNLCCYSQRTCNLEKLKGFDFCHKHILEDKASPFKPCDFVAKSNGRRCPNPAPKLPDRGKSFCIIHTRKAELRRAVEERRKRRHHKGDGDESYDGNKDKRRRTSSSNSQKSDKLDGHSSDEEGGASGDDYLKVDSAWHGDIDSDADSVDSEEEDPLKHAGVWTVEETTRMCRDKMIRLRSLYIAQFKRLQHVLKERKRKYCQAIQAEEEEETGECHLTPTQLLGHKRQHERPGTEALLHKQAKEKKQGTSPRQQAVSTLRCTYSPGGIRCTEKVLPLTKHCIKHITHDPNQLLFQKCAFQSKGDSPCDRNVAKVFNHTSCRLHLELPASMKRPDVRKDLQDARERAELRKARALEQKDKPDVPETLQQKSSALVPPSITGQTEETATTTSEPQQDTTSTPSDSLSAAPKKMEIDNNDVTCKSDGECKLSTNSANAASSSASSSGVAVSAPAPALESISPCLAAASLVAVCSSPQVPLQGTPLASISDIKQLSVTDLKPLPATSSEQQSISNAPCDDAKGDVGSKLPEVTGGERSKETKEATAVDPKNTLSAPQEMTERVSRSPNGNNTTAVQSERPGSVVEQPEETKAKLHVDKDKDEVKVPTSASQCASQTAAQGTSQVVASQGTSSTFSKVISPTAKIVPQNLSVDSKQITSKSASQGTSNTSKVISPTAKIVPQNLSENSKQVTSKSASQGIPNTSKVTLPTSMKATPQESSEIPSKVTSKSAWHVTSNVSPKVTSATTKVAPRESSEDSSQFASKSALHVTSNVSLKVTFATTKVVPRESPEDSSQVAPKSTMQGYSKGVLHEAHKATSQGTLPAPHSVPKQPSLVASVVHPPQPTATSSTTSQPSKPNPAKLHMTSDTPRSTSVKLFQHLPAGMTSSSSKQFSAIASVLSKETNKDSKTDVAKPKDQGNPAKL